MTVDDPANILREDTTVKKLLEQSKQVKFPYKTYKSELDGMTVGATPDADISPDAFERIIVRLHKVQSMLDRIMEIRNVLVGVRGDLKSLYKPAALAINGYDILQKFRNKEQREALVEEVLQPITSKLNRLEDLLDIIKEMVWNLKHTSSTISIQLDVAKQIVWLRSPERFLKDKDRR